MEKKKELIWVGVIVLLFISLIVIFKLTYRDIQQPPLAINSNVYEKIDFNRNTSLYQLFKSINPKIKMAIPVSFEMNTVIENQSVKIYNLTYKDHKIQIRIIDLYGLTNTIATARKEYSYNVYSDYSMKNSYREYIKTYSEKNPRKNIIESGIKTLNGNLLIYLKDENIDNYQNPINTIRYNFLNNGYSIEVIGYNPEFMKNDTIINSMNSFSYYE